MAGSDPTIVLVHGAFADASSRRGLYDALVGEGLPMIAPPNPLRGLTGGDGEYLKAVIDRRTGSADRSLLRRLGHHRGRPCRQRGRPRLHLRLRSGCGENLTDLQSKFPAGEIIPYIVEHQLPEAGNEFTLASGGFHESFCADIPADDTAFYAIAPRPLAGVALTEAARTSARLSHSDGDLQASGPSTTVRGRWVVRLVRGRARRPALQTAAPGRVRAA